MGRRSMGSTSRNNRKGCAPGCSCGRHRSNAGSFDTNRANMEAGARTRYVRKHALPCIGDRFGELTVVGLNIGRAGGYSAFITVQCSCGAPPHKVYDYNLRKGRSTRCNACARKQSAHWRKNFWAYADVVPSDDHRRRLLNRISACINRCTNPNDKGYPNYGGRGITVHPEWRANRRAFLEYLVSLPGWDQANLELDRKDVHKGYEPGNLRFITKRENQGNRRTIQQMQRYIIELEARLRSCQCGAAQPIHCDNGQRSDDRP